MSNYYEINVSLHGKHFFATAPRSITSKHHLYKVYEAFQSRFQKHEGYNITISYHETLGKQVNINEN